MNKYTAIIIFLFIFAIPAFSNGEGTIETAGTGNADIPITRVTLYTAGLAQIVQETTVTDNESISFQVEPKDINDILKSLIVEDLDGGTVDVVTFNSNDPLSVVLGDLRVDPSGSPALTDFLKHTQGEAVVVTTEKGLFRGRIFSVETFREDNRLITILNLMDSNGIQRVDITELKNLQFEDPQLQKEIVSALGMIARSRVKTVRTLKISCKGSGKRKIRLSYIRAVPLWKTSYRLVLNEAGIPRLEGWAIVQNTGSQSWKNVRLGFVAGQPNAFTMDLATPRYITRKQVDIVSAAPIGATSYGKASPPESARAKSMAYSGASSRAVDDYKLEEQAAYNPAPLAPQASGIREGNFYRYDVKLPVTVGARSSGMIPIIMQEDVGKSIAVYDPAYNKVFKGVRLVNSTGAHWAAGPVTVIEGRYYGGDALLPDMIPGSSRILTYAVHGTLEVQKTRSVQPQRITSLKITDGILYRTDKAVRETRYNIDGDGDGDELILIHPREAGWKLIKSPEVLEETPREYRFVLHSWKKPVLVEEEYTISNQFSLSSVRNSDLTVYLEWKEISPRIKRAPGKITELKLDTENIRGEINSLKNQINRIERDQNRIRQNMKVLDKKSDLFQQYASQLSVQETQLKDINSQIGDRQTKLQSANKVLRDYITALDL